MIKLEKTIQNLKVGDLVVFKKYEDVDDEEKSVISKNNFPKFGKVSGVYDTLSCFGIEGKPCIFKQEAIDYIIMKKRM